MACTVEKCGFKEPEVNHEMVKKEINEETDLL